MNVRIEPHPLSGIVAAIPSKSMAHRLLILAGLCDQVTDIELASRSQDIDATLRCLVALGVSVSRTRTGLRIVPLGMRGTKARASLDVGESGSTLRFLLPVCAALGVSTTITGHGRLAERPLSPLDDELARHGAQLSAGTAFPRTLTGTLTPGRFTLPGSVSSQFASGLLMAAPLMDGASEIWVSEPVESLGYLNLTVAALEAFGVRVTSRRAVEGDTCYRVWEVPADARLESPRDCVVEGDWSNAAFWLAAGALGSEPLCVSGLDARSRQGDRAILAALTLLGAHVGRSNALVAASRDHLHGHTIDVSGIPDLAAPLAAVAASAQGTTRLTGAARLRLKESDRLETIRAALVALGGRAEICNDELVIEGVGGLAGGTVDAARDHRIAMMAAVCAAYASDPTTILGADCVAKSYPGFFDDFRALGGIAHHDER